MNKYYLREDGTLVVPDSSMIDDSPFADSFKRQWKRHIASLPPVPGVVIDPEFKIKSGWVENYKIRYQRIQNDEWKFCPKDIYDYCEEYQRPHLHRIVLVDPQKERYDEEFTGEVLGDQNNPEYKTEKKQEEKSEEEKSNVTPVSNWNPPIVEKVPDYLEHAFENWLVAQKEFNDGYRNVGGKMTRINIAALSTACTQADTELRKCFNRYKAHTPPVSGEPGGLQWISVEERLPDKHDQYYVRYSDGDKGVSWFHPHPDPDSDQWENYPNDEAPVEWLSESGDNK